jgi:DNA uptake protein ComE-like DNA-binding protein
MAFFNWLSTVKSAGIPGTQSLRNRILQDPFYRLQSVEEVAIAASLGVHIDVNQAGVDDWLRLPGLSIHQAKVLADLAQAGVPLHCLEDVAAAIGVPVQRLQPLAPVLRFFYYDPESVATIQPMDANRATMEMLVRIPVVDLYLAKAIVENRRLGQYRNITHLQRRLSIPPTVIAELMHYLKF